jgi:phage tail sheath gpL-like
MANTTTILYLNETDAPDLRGHTGKTALQHIRNNLNGIIGGNKRGTSVVTYTAGTSAVAASGTVTCASASAADTVTIAGIVFTAIAGTPAGNQFKVGVSDTADAASLVSAINGSTTAGVQNCVVATSVAGVVTITAKLPGAMGNAITLASSNGTRLAVSGARLANGAGADVTPTTITV